MDLGNSLKQAVEKARKICFFGIGALLGECYDQLILSLGRGPDFLCDNAPDKWGKEFFGKQCVSPHMLADVRDGLLVIITIRQYESIMQQLQELGISDVFTARFDSSYYALRGLIRLGEDNRQESGQEPDMIDVRGKWTMITGASRGIGRQIALAMAQLGSNIIAHSRSINHVESLMEACANLGVECVPIEAELTKVDAIESIFIQMKNAVPHVDIVFNNAAIATPLPETIWTITSEAYVNYFKVNTVVPALISRELIPGMEQRGFGRIINITSGMFKVVQEIPYVCSKVALERFVFETALKLSGSGVMMMLTDPGWVRTESGTRHAPNAVESVVPGILLGALLNADINGCRVNAQDYAGLTLELAIQRALTRLRQSSSWI